MPVEIREMVVKAIVPPKEKTQQREENSEEGEREEPLDQSQIVEACVAAVMRIIEKKERR